MSDVEQAAAVIARRAPGVRSRVGIVLGSGLGPYVDWVDDAVGISYGELPGFPQPGVEGHAGELLLGRVGTTGVAVLRGRAHLYETGRADAMKVAIRTLGQIGCEALLLTNAAGSLHTAAGPGSVMLINDHINFAGVSPLFGEAGSDRFVDMVDAYDPGLRGALHAAAAAQGVTLHEGVYMFFCGPSFETPAEIRAAGTLGADAVGMSTVPEVILARHAGLRVAALSIITNLAAGMSAVALSHQQSLDMSARAAADVQTLLKAFLVDYGG